MPTLSLPQYQAVCRALGRGLRHCEIARELDLSVWTIDRIASDLDRARYRNPKRQRGSNTNPTRKRGSAAQPGNQEGVGSQLRQAPVDMENGQPQLTPDPFPLDAANGHGGPHAPREDGHHAERDDYQGDLPEDDAPPDYVATRLRRCQGCGGMVYQWPCLTCRLRAPLAGTKPGPGEVRARSAIPTRPLREQVCSRLRTPMTKDQ